MGKYISCVYAKIFGHIHLIKTTPTDCQHAHNISSVHYVHVHVRWTIYMAMELKSDHMTTNM